MYISHLSLKNKDTFLQLKKYSSNNTFSSNLHIIMNRMNLYKKKR